MFLLVAVIAVEYSRCGHLDRSDLKSLEQFGYLHKTHIKEIDPWLFRTNHLKKSPCNANNVNFVAKQKSLNFGSRTKKTINSLFSDALSAINVSNQLTVMKHWHQLNQTVERVMKLNTVQYITLHLLCVANKFNALKFRTFIWYGYFHRTVKVAEALMAFYMGQVLHNECSDFFR